MGIFSRKKTTYVSSVAYNLAGDEDDRPDFMKATILGAIFGEKNIAETIPESYLRGQGIKIRNFARWARTQGYSDTLGQSRGGITSGDSIDTTVIAGEIPPSTVGNTVIVQTAKIDDGDYTWWADQYICENYPARLGTDYVTDYNQVTGDLKITFEDDTFVTFTPANFDPNSRYLYASYVETKPGTSGPIDTGATIILGSGDDFPDTTDWEELTNASTSHTENLDVVTTVDVTYSDDRPSEHSNSTTTSTESYDEVHASYEQFVAQPAPANQDVIKAERSIMYQDAVGEVVTNTIVTTTTETITGGVIKTTTTTVTTDSLEVERSYRIDEQEVIYKGWSTLKVFIYKQGSGNTVFDAMFKTPSNIGNFLPFIPFRIDNRDVKNNWPDLYAQSKKAFVKATGSKYDKVRDNINSNAQIGEIDFAYAVFGVSLNVKENACRKYIYKFFKLVSDDPNRKTAADYDNWKSLWQAADDSWTVWLAWHDNPTDHYDRMLPEPVRLEYPSMPTNSVKVRSNNSCMNYDITLTWNFISEEQGSGLLKPGAKKGEYWLTNGTSENWSEQTYTQDGDSRPFRGLFGRDNTTDLLYVNWQVSATEWKRLIIRGLTHTNLVYNGKSVFIGSKEALEDPDESGFIIPLHEDVFRSMGLKDGTQMGTACCFLMFNCYKVVKQKWYQTFLFKVILIVIVVAVTIFFPPGGAAGGGLLGTNIAVGAALGFTGTMAIVVGTLLNYLAAMLIMSLITRTAVHYLGEEWGLIIGTIAGLITLQVGTGMANGLSFSASFNNLLRVDNLLLLTNSVGNAYAEILNKDAQETMKKAAELQDKFTKDLKALQEKYSAEFGRNGILDPTQMVNLLLSPHESSEAFLTRTLMVGSDLADMSMEMLYNFVNITLSNDLPT